MITLHAKDLFVVTVEISEFAVIVEKIENGGLPSNLNAKDKVSKEIIKDTSVRVERLAAALGDIPAPLTKISLENLRGALDYDQLNYSHLREHFHVIRGRMRDELSLLHCFALTADTLRHFDESVSPWGDGVASAFPSAAYDISEAGKCLALRRSTACVTHLMRSLEVGLAALAVPFQVVAAQTNWQNIIDQIESKVSKMGPAYGPHWKADQAFFSKAATYFRIFKDGWRNHAMHVREKYTEEEAEDIYRATRSLMRHLSQKISESKGD